MGVIEQAIIDRVYPLNDLARFIGCKVGRHDWAATGTKHVWACRLCPEMKAGRR
jgi:hypothetical protein